MFQLQVSKSSSFLKKKIQTQKNPKCLLLDLFFPLELPLFVPFYVTFPDALRGKLRHGTGTTKRAICVEEPTETPMAKSNFLRIFRHLLGVKKGIGKRKKKLEKEMTY